ncbi:MAG TPA: GIDE domain-containing protein [Gammaproteobacteria bacterium]|nr:GIDE domain-containing protein [Gammaproteobacteria bacterium]
MTGLSAWVQGFGPWPFVMLTGGAGILAAGGFYTLWRNLRRARIIADTPTARIRSAPQGYVELAGTGQPYDGGPAVSPLTGRKCLWYRYRIERKETTGFGKNRHSQWRTIQQGESDDPFLLEDGTDWCEVHPEGAEVTSRHRRVWCTSGSDPNSLRLSMQVGRLTLNFGGRYRHTEELLLPGPVYALGWFRTLSDAPPPIDGAVRERLERWQAAPGVFMEQFDANGDGRLDAAERQRARALARSRVMAERAADGPGVSFHVLARPEESGRPFLLAGHTAEALEGHYRTLTRWSLAALVAGASVALTLLALRA